MKTKTKLCILGAFLFLAVSVWAAVLGLDDPADFFAHNNPGAKQAADFLSKAKDAAAVSAESGQ